MADREWRQRAISWRRSLPWSFAEIARAFGHPTAELQSPGSATVGV